MPRRRPPVTDKGGRHRSPPPLTRGPHEPRAARRCGPWALEQSDRRRRGPWSPGAGQATPAKRRRPVPELPQSIGAAGWQRGYSGRRSRRARAPCRSTVAPRAATAATVRRTSSPSDRPRIVLVPSARAAEEEARWEIGLVPRRAHGPRQPAAAGRATEIRQSGPSDRVLTRGTSSSGVVTVRARIVARYRGHDGVAQRLGVGLGARPARARPRRPSASGRSRCRRC